MFMIFITYLCDDKYVMCVYCRSLLQGKWQEAVELIQKPREGVKHVSETNIATYNHLKNKQKFQH